MSNLYIYRNELCDPAQNIGTCRQFQHSVDLDAYVNLFVASIEPRYLGNYRIFITNDEVEFQAVDNYVQMNEHLLADGAKTRRSIIEVNVKERALEVNAEFIAKETARQLAMKAVDKRIKKRREGGST